MARTERRTHEVVVEADTYKSAMAVVTKRWYQIHGAPMRAYGCKGKRCRGRLGPFTLHEAEHVATELCPALKEFGAERCSSRVVAKKR